MDVDNPEKEDAEAAEPKENENSGKDEIAVDDDDEELEQEEDEEEQQQYLNSRKPRNSRRNTRHSLAAAVAAAAAVLRECSGSELPPALALASFAGADAGGVFGEEGGEEIPTAIGPPKIDGWDVELELIRKCFVKVPARLGRPIEDEPAPLSPKSRQGDLTDALLALSDGEQGVSGGDSSPRPGAASIAAWEQKRFPLDQLTANDGEPTALHPAALFYLRHLDEEVAAEERALKREAEERAARKEAKRLEKQAAMAGGGGAPSGSGAVRSTLPKPANLSLRGKSIEEVEEALMERLTTYVTALGGILPDGWRVKASIRQNGANAGGVDAYYYDPSGRRHKSMVRVAEVLGLEATAAAKPKTLASILGTGSGKRGRAAMEEAAGDGGADGAGDDTAKGTGGEETQGGAGEGAKEGAKAVAGPSTAPAGGGGGDGSLNSPVAGSEDPNSAKKTCGKCRNCLNPQLKKGCTVNRSTKVRRNWFRYIFLFYFSVFV